MILQGDDFDQAQRHARRIMRENGMTFIPAFDDPGDCSRAGDHWSGDA